MKIINAGYKKVRLLNEAIVKKQNLQLQGLAEKAAEKCMSKIKNFKELECKKSLDINE